MPDPLLDKLTGKRFTFFVDPDGLPLELYEERVVLILVLVPPPRTRRIEDE
jgi:hypothetical protein